MPATPRIRAHVGRATKAGDPTQRRGRAVALEIDLQGRADEHVAGVMPRGLAKGAVGAQGPVRAGEEHVRPGADVVLHAKFGTEQWTFSTNPASIAGISAGCGFSAQLRQILPFKPSDAA